MEISKKKKKEQQAELSAIWQSVVINTGVHELQDK